MSLTKETVVDKVEVLENGCVQVRTATRILEDGEILSQSYHRHVCTPDHDCSAEDPKVQAICMAVHTPEVKAAWAASQVQPEATPEAPSEPVAE